MSMVHFLKPDIILCLLSQAPFPFLNHVIFFSYFLSYLSYLLESPFLFPLFFLFFLYFPPSFSSWCNKKIKKNILPYLPRSVGSH